MNQVTSDMPEVMKLAASRAIKTLSSMPGCCFKVRLPNGETILYDPAGDLDGKPKGRNGRTKRALRNPGIPYGELTIYLKAFVDNMKPGEVVCIPYTDPDTKTTYVGKSIASSAASFMAKTYGAGNYTTYRNDVKKCVEVYLSGGVNE